MFGAKFGVPPNPIEQEQNAKEVRPTDGALRRALEQHLQKLSEDNNSTAFTEIINKYRGKEKIRDAKNVIKKDFQQRFDAFLLGRMDPVTGSRTRGMPYTKTPGWGNRNTSIMNNREVRQYINDKDNARAMFDRHIFVMRALGTAVGYDPLTGAYWAPGLEEWYLYYKYILEDNSHDDAEYLADYKKYRNRLTPQNDFDKRYYTMGGFGDHPPPDEGAVHQFEEFTGEQRNPNVMPVGDANPGHFGPEEHDGYWRTKVPMENRARTRKDLFTVYQTDEAIATQKAAVGANLNHPPTKKNPGGSTPPPDANAAVNAIMDPQNSKLSHAQKIQALLAHGLDQTQALDLTNFWTNLKATKDPNVIKHKVENALRKVYGSDENIPSNVKFLFEQAIEQSLNKLSESELKQKIASTEKSVSDMRTAIKNQQKTLETLLKNYDSAKQAERAITDKTTKTAQDARDNLKKATAAVKAQRELIKKTFVNYKYDNEVLVNLKEMEGRAKLRRMILSIL